MKNIVLRSHPGRRWWVPEYQLERWEETVHSGDGPNLRLPKDALMFATILLI